MANRRPNLNNDQILAALGSELSYACTPTDHSNLSQSQRLNLRLNELSKSNSILKGFVIKAYDDDNVCIEHKSLKRTIVAHRGTDGIGELFKIIPVAATLVGRRTGGISGAGLGDIAKHVVGPLGLGKGITGTRDIGNDLGLIVNRMPRQKSSDAFMKKCFDNAPKGHLLIRTGHSGGIEPGIHSGPKMKEMYGDRAKVIAFNPGASHFTKYRGQNRNPQHKNNIEILRISGDIISYYSKRAGKYIDHKGYEDLNPHSLDNFLRMAQESQQKRKNEFGGVDMSVGIADFQIHDKSISITGFILNGESSFLTINKRQTTHISEMNISINDLALALFIFYREDISYRSILFSLDPWDEDNPEGPYHRKVYWPDKEEDRQIIENTDFGEILFKCDYIMKQMSMDMQSNSNPSPIISPRLRSLGLKASHKMGIGQGNSWVSNCLVIESIKFGKRRGLKDNEKQLEVIDAKIGVEARVMEINSHGKLHDKVLQDVHHGSYLFAKKFTELYDEIAKEFTEFYRLKQIAKAIALAKWMRINSIPIDLNKVQDIINSRAKIRSDPRIDSLTRSYNDGNSRISLFGGVSLDFDISTLSEKQADKPHTSQVHIKYIAEKINIKACRHFPFQPQEKCIECSSELSLSEISKCHKTMYCTYHNPLLCQSCYKPFEGNYVQNQGESFHNECFICQLCKDIILPGNEFVIVDSCNFHPSCSTIFNENIEKVREFYNQLELEDEIERQKVLHTEIEDARESDLFHKSNRRAFDRVDTGRR